MRSYKLLRGKDFDKQIKENENKGLTQIFVRFLPESARILPELDPFTFLGGGWGGGGHYCTPAHPLPPSHTPMIVLSACVHTHIIIQEQRWIHAQERKSCHPYTLWVKKRKPRFYFRSLKKKKIAKLISGNDSNPSFIWHIVHAYWITDDCSAIIL